MQTTESANGLDDVIARLKASKDKSEAGEHQDGFSAGEDWAGRQSEYSELRRLAGPRASPRARLASGSKSAIRCDSDPPAPAYPGTRDPARDCGNGCYNRLSRQRKSLWRL